MRVPQRHPAAIRRTLVALRDLARGNPAARTLRLLEALARGAVDDFSMPLLNGRVTVRVTPCSAVRTSWN